jgi:hypothetical protein
MAVDQPAISRLRRLSRDLPAVSQIGDHQAGVLDAVGLGVGDRKD